MLFDRIVPTSGKSIGFGALRNWRAAGQLANGPTHRVGRLDCCRAALYLGNRAGRTSRPSRGHVSVHIVFGDRHCSREVLRCLRLSLLLNDGAATDLGEVDSDRNERRAA